MGKTGSYIQSAFEEIYSLEPSFLPAVKRLGFWTPHYFLMSPKKITDVDKLEIANLYRQPWETAASLANRYGVSNSTISRVLKNSIPEHEYEVLIQQKRAASKVGGDENEAITEETGIISQIVLPPPPEINYGTTRPNPPESMGEIALIDGSPLADGIIVAIEDTLPVLSTDPVHNSTIFTPSLTSIMTEDRSENTRRVRRRSSALSDDLQDPVVVVETPILAESRNPATVDSTQFSQPDPTVPSRGLVILAERNEVVSPLEHLSQPPGSINTEAASPVAIGLPPRPSSGVEIGTSGSSVSISDTYAPAATRDPRLSPKNPVQPPVPRTPAWREDRPKQDDYFTTISAAPFPVEEIPEDESEEDVDIEDVNVLAAMFGEEIADGDDDEEFDDDEDGDEDPSTPDRQLERTQLLTRDLLHVQVTPLSQATLPRTCYIVIDKFAELIVRPLKDFADLGQIPGEEVQQRTLPIFDNQRVAKRFSNQRTQRVIKVPDSRIFQKTSHHLRLKGITRLLVDGNIYSLN